MQLPITQLPASELCFMQWQGRPVVYIDQSYWLYERDAKTNKITLTGCVAVLKDFTH